MPEIIGRLSDFQGKPGLELDLRVVFRPNGPAVGGLDVFYSRPVIVDEFEADGTFRVQLQSTDELWHITGNDVWYEVTIDWQEDGEGWMPWDQPGWRLKVPAEGGQFSALVTAPTNPAQMWVGPARAQAQGTPDWDRPLQPLVPSTYTGWYKTNALPGEPNYFEWE